MKTLLFADREKEWEKVEDTLTRLTQPEQLLRDPILAFYGVGGIGKSTLLVRTARECLDRDIWYAFVDFEQQVNGDKRWPHVVEEIGNQLGLSGPVRTRATTYIQAHKEWDQAAQDEFVAAMLGLLKDEKRPVVWFFDTLDRADDETLRWLEYSLRDLLDAGRLLVVLGSKMLIRFEGTREVTRKLRPYRLRPLLPDGTRQQLEQLAQAREIEKAITEDLLKEILDLTAGHPLANKVVFDAILDHGLDPGREEDQHQLVDALFERVIQRWILADIEPEEQRRYQAILIPLSIPRQFNLEMMKDLIGQFAPEKYALPGGVAYMDLVGDIRRETFLVEWDSSRQGYAMDPTMRRIFASWLHLKEPHRFDEITDWLAKTYEHWAGEASGSDRARYILEKLYHTSHLEADRAQEVLVDFFDRLYADETFDRQVQLLEELQADNELREVLGETRFEEMVRYLEQRIRH